MICPTLPSFTARRPEYVLFFTPLAAVTSKQFRSLGRRDHFCFCMRLQHGMPAALLGRYVCYMQNLEHGNAKTCLTDGDDWGTKKSVSRWCDSRFCAGSNFFSRFLQCRVLIQHTSFYKAPWPVMTTRTVRNRILRSLIRQQFFRYSRS